MIDVAPIGIQKGFDGETFQLWNIIAPGNPFDGSTIMIKNPCTRADALAAATTKLHP